MNRNTPRPSFPLRMGRAFHPVPPFVAVLLLAAAFLLLPSDRAAADGLRADNGVLDLRGFDPATMGPARLDGAWEFYWNRLLTPQDFAASTAPSPSGLISLPGTWRGMLVNGETLGGTGQATLRLRLRLWPEADTLTLRLFDIPMAYRLWANGQLVAGSGIVGTDADSETPLRSLVLARIAPEGEDLELVLQISNHHFRAGGVPEGLRLALPGPLEAERDRIWTFSYFFAGCLLITLLYHLFLFHLDRMQVSAGYFSGFCLCMLCYCMSSNTSFWAINRFLPALPPPWSEYVPLFFYMACAPMLFRFYYSLYPKVFHPAIRYLVDLRLAVFFLLLLTAPDYRVSQYIAFSIFVGLGCAIYYVVRLFVCTRRGMSGAGLLLLGSGVSLLASLNDGLSHAKLINTPYLIQFGILFLVVTQSLALAKRFTHAFISVGKLSEELERKNRSLMAEMEERNRLEQEVINISEDERRRISHELHDGLCQKLTGARLRASILNKRLAGTDDATTMASLVALLDASTDDAYRTSRGLWPVEHDPAMPGPSLDDLARRIAKDTGINVRFEMRRYCGQCTNPNMRTLYRIAQEALTNAAKHAQAQTIRVKLRCPAQDGVTLTVCDDGIGRTASARKGTRMGGLGLGIMAHRADVIHAKLTIEDAPQGGTVVTCAAPCDKLASPTATRRTLPDASR
ncbi:sensor histidine kinase [Desulfovibrio psychrotolerans]|nr:7TM diverse intracellular signaling domain-containing protein [Desulfovibrio psychrotolerans]